MTRRIFLKFIVLGGVAGYFTKKIKTGKQMKEAKFWRKAK